MKPSHLLFLLVFLSTGTLFSSEIREFKSSDGRSIKAELIEVRQNSEGVIVVELRRSDRRYFTIPFNKFSPADQKYLKGIWDKKQSEASLLKPDHRISLSLKLNRKTQGKDDATYYYGSTVKDRKIRYEPEVTIENDELTQSFTGNKIRLVVIAKSKHEEGQYLIACASDLKADFPAKDTVSVFGNPFLLAEYEYDNGWDHNYDYEYGYEKDDYVILVINREGEITHSRTSSNRFLKNLEKVKSCRTGEVYSEDLEYKITSSISTSYFQSAER